MTKKRKRRKTAEPQRVVSLRTTKMTKLWRLACSLRSLLLLLQLLPRLLLHLRLLRWKNQYFIPIRPCPLRCTRTSASCRQRPKGALEGLPRIPPPPPPMIHDEPRLPLLPVPLIPSTTTNQKAASFPSPQRPSLRAAWPLCCAVYQLAAGRVWCHQEPLHHRRHHHPLSRVWETVRVPVRD